MTERQIKRAVLAFVAFLAASMALGAPAALAASAQTPTTNHVIRSDAHVQGIGRAMAPRSPTAAQPRDHLNDPWASLLLG